MARTYPIISIAKQRKIPTEGEIKTNGNVFLKTKLSNRIETNRIATKQSA